MFVVHSDSNHPSCLFFAHDSSIRISRVWFERWLAGALRLLKAAREFVTAINCKRPGSRPALSEKDILVRGEPYSHCGCIRKIADSPRILRPGDGRITKNRLILPSHSGSSCEKLHHATSSCRNNAITTASSCQFALGFGTPELTDK